MADRDVLDFDIGTVTYTERDGDDFYRAQVDPLGDTKGAPAFEVYHPYGFVGRPKDPDVDPNTKPTVGPTALFAYEGNQGHAILLNDPRVMEKLPGAKKGESFMYGDAGQFIRCHDDGAISQFTTDDGTPNGRSIFHMMSPAKAFVWSCPWGRMTLGPEGFEVLHSSGARFSLGAIGGLAAPLDAISSCAQLQAGAISINGSAVSLGTDNGAANLAAVTALQVLLAAVGAVVASLNAAAVAPADVNTLKAAVAAALAAFNLTAPNIGKIA